MQRAAVTLRGAMLRPALMPGWMLSFAHEGRPYHFLVNGRTGGFSEDWPPLFTRQGVERFLCAALLSVGLVALLLGGLFALAVLWQAWQLKHP